MRVVIGCGDWELSGELRRPFIAAKELLYNKKDFGILPYYPLSDCPGGNFGGEIPL
jgi:hypothetical protein